MDLMFSIYYIIKDFILFSDDDYMVMLSTMSDEGVSGGDY